MSHYLLHQALFNARTVREIDQSATGKGDIPGAELMRRAGQAAFTELLENFGRPECIHVFVDQVITGVMGILLPL